MGSKVMRSVNRGIQRARLIGADMGNRHPDDFYATSRGATEALLAAESFEGGIWEPACGNGAISRVLEAAGHRVVSSDLVDRGFGEIRIDFLMETRLRAPNVVTNPPFKLASEFVRHALALGAGKVAMLLKVGFLEGKGRADLYDAAPFARLHVFRERQTFLRNGDGVGHDERRGRHDRLRLVRLGPDPCWPADAWMAAAPTGRRAVSAPRTRDDVMRDLFAAGATVERIAAAVGLSSRSHCVRLLHALGLRRPVGWKPAGFNPWGPGGCLERARRGRKSAAEVAARAAAEVVVAPAGPAARAPGEAEAIAAHIAAKGVTRCPPAAVAPGTAALGAGGAIRRHAEALAEAAAGMDARRQAAGRAAVRARGGAG